MLKVTLFATQNDWFLLKCYSPYLIKIILYYRLETTPISKHLYYRFFYVTLCLSWYQKILFFVHYIINIVTVLVLSGCTISKLYIPPDI
jgi:hypothetical protein